MKKLFKVLKTGTGVVKFLRKKKITQTYRKVEMMVRTCQTCKVELFAKIVNALWTLIIFTKKTVSWMLNRNLNASVKVFYISIVPLVRNRNLNASVKVFHIFDRVDFVHISDGIQ